MPWSSLSFNLRSSIRSISLNNCKRKKKREDMWPRRWRRRGHVCCRRCQQPGHIARHCKAPATIPAGRRQPSVTASPAPKIDARNSAVPTAGVERQERSNGVDRKGVLSLTDSSSDAAGVGRSLPTSPGSAASSETDNCYSMPPQELRILRT